MASKGKVRRALVTLDAGVVPVRESPGRQPGSWPSSRTGHPELPCSGANLFDVFSTPSARLGVALHPARAPYFVGYDLVCQAIAQPFPRELPEAPVPGSGKPFNRRENAFAQDRPLHGHLRRGQRRGPNHQASSSRWWPCQRARSMDRDHLRGQGRTCPSASEQLRPGRAAIHHPGISRSCQAGLPRRSWTCSTHCFEQ